MDAISEGRALHLSTTATAVSQSHGRVRFVFKSTHDPLAEDGPNVIRNLSLSPKRISAVYVYDQLGSQLFEQQCRTPEYYLRRAEAVLLKAYAGDILRQCGVLPIVELGSGTAEKTRILLAEFAKRGTRCDYFPIDVDLETLAAAAHRLVEDYPKLYVHCLGGTYEECLAALPRDGRTRLFLFLGSSLGNMEWHEMDALLAQIFRHASPGDYLLVGADLDKDPAVIDRAYNDAAGFGARSTLNMLSHLNWRYGGDFALDRYAYRSAYNAVARRNEVRIESLARQAVTLRKLELRVALGESELIDAEVMWKFEPKELTRLLENAGFSLIHDWIEPIYRYGIFLLQRQ
jgi:dimethylhistidine N-methyltransferase